jgi:hypothetical protein
MIGCGTRQARSRWSRRATGWWARAPATSWRRRAYYARIAAELHDLRGQAQRHPEWFDPDPARYGPAQALGAGLRAAGSDGVVYPSVRRSGGECVGAFRPRVVAPVTQGPHFEFLWDGRAITDVLQVRRVRGWMDPG